jgi:ABC-type branched-subunit amino acid transport system permease subunit
MPPHISNMPLAVIPGILMFAILSAFVSAGMALAGYACGYLILRRRATLTVLFTLAFVLAAVVNRAPELLTKWTALSQDDNTLLTWMPLLGGLAISFMGSKSTSEDFRRPAKPGSELVRRRLAIAEGAVLVFPLLVLWPFLVVFALENYSRMST